MGVCRDLTFFFTYVIQTIELKLVSLCLISHYSLITYLHIFVYERAELSSISVYCTYDYQ